MYKEIYLKKHTLERKKIFEKNMEYFLLRIEVIYIYI